MVRNRLGLVAAAIVVLAMVGGGVVVATSDSTADPADGTAQPTDNTTIQVSASGSVSSAPDKAVLRVGVEATARNASVARERVAENVSALRTALQEFGLEERQIRTTDYDVYKEERRERHRKEPGAESTVYRARHQIALELDDVDSAGSVVDTAIASGATELHDIDFTLSADTRRTLRERALQQAMTNARSDASTLASSENLTVSGVDVITTVDRRGGGPRHTEVAYADGGTGSTSIDAGPVTVSVSVTVTYEATASTESS